jgi:hypothetical protein
VRFSNIAFLDNHDVVSVTANTSSDRITGARIVSRRSHSEFELAADLVGGLGRQRA